MLVGPSYGGPSYVLTEAENHLSYAPMHASPCRSLRVYTTTMYGRAVILATLNQ